MQHLCYSRAQASELWVKGEKVTCGYISEDTRVTKKEDMLEMQTEAKLYVSDSFSINVLVNRWCSDPRPPWSTSSSRWAVRCGPLIYMVRPTSTIFPFEDIDTQMYFVDPFWMLRLQVTSTLKRLSMVSCRICLPSGRCVCHACLPLMSLTLTVVTGYGLW